MAASRWGLVVAVRLRPWIGCQTAKFKIYDFAKSKKQAFGSALLALGEKFQFLSDLSF